MDHIEPENRALIPKARERAKERTKDVDRQHPSNRNITNITPKSERDIEARNQMVNKLSGDLEVAIGLRERIQFTKFTLSSTNLVEGWWLSRTPRRPTPSSRVPGASVSHEHSLFLRLVAALAVCGTRVDSVLVVEAAADRVAFDELIAHSCLFEALQ
ncbi:uncharacterized protein BDW70DRAFT_30878 [Aspergillus foveolatus]|uniref:uncharacterized protein n=1 Tax=Aspergillus foveolatus TaxID=210207 RepID=UPI003CCE511F